MKLAALDPITLPKNGSPADRGSADAYYGRPPLPHKYPLGTYKCDRVELTDPDEIREYLEAFWAEDDRKDWG